MIMDPQPPGPAPVAARAHHLRFAQACGMLGFSGRGGVEGGGIFQFDLATQEALCSLGERAPDAIPPGLLEQSADPGRAATVKALLRTYGMF